MIVLRSKVALEKFFSQLFSSLRPRLLRLIKAVLERGMFRLRDEVIGNRRCEHGGELKRWGYGALVVDGIYRRFRDVGKAVILVASGVTGTGDSRGSPNHCPQPPARRD